MGETMSFLWRSMLSHAKDRTLSLWDPFVGTFQRKRLLTYFSPLTNKNLFQNCWTLIEVAREGIAFCLGPHDERAACGEFGVQRRISLVFFESGC